MRGFFIHYLMRLKWSLKDPYTLGALLFTGVLSLLYWPGPVDPADVKFSFISEEEGLSSVCLVIIWVFVWPMLAGSVAGGSVAARGRDAFAQRPVPSLPVGARARVLAEAMLILTFVFVLRIPSFTLGESVHCNFYLPGLIEPQEHLRAAFILRSLYGTLIMFPAVLVWTAPSRSIHLYFMVRPLALIALMLLAMKLGCLATPLGCILTCIVLSAAILLTMDLEFHPPRMLKPSNGSPEARWRPGRDPESQLRRDRWLKPLPAVALFLALEALVIAIDQVVVLPEYGFYFMSVFVISFLFSLVALKPFGCNLFAVGIIIASSGSSRTSDFLRAWSILPVRIEAVLRSVYCHGFLIGLGIWVLAVTVEPLSSWLKTGELQFEGFGDNHAGRYILPMITLVPCLPAGLVAAATGDRLRGFLSVGAGIAILVGHHAFLMLGLAPAIHLGLLILFALVGGVPALTHLRAPRTVDTKG